MYICTYRLGRIDDGNVLEDALFDKDFRILDKRYNLADTSLQNITIPTTFYAPIMVSDVISRNKLWLVRNQ